MLTANTRKTELSIYGLIHISVYPHIGLPTYKLIHIRDYPNMGISAYGLIHILAYSSTVRTYATHVATGKTPDVESNCMYSFLSLVHFSLQ